MLRVGCAPVHAAKSLRRSDADARSGSNMPRLANSVESALRSLAWLLLASAASAQTCTMPADTTGYDVASPPSLGLPDLNLPDLNLPSLDGPATVALQGPARGDVFATQRVEASVVAPWPVQVLRNT